MPIITSCTGKGHSPSDWCRQFMVTKDGRKEREGEVGKYGCFLLTEACLLQLPHLPLHLLCPAQRGQTQQTPIFALVAGVGEDAPASISGQSLLLEAGRVHLELGVQLLEGQLLMILLSKAAAASRTDQRRQGLIDAPPPT